jgi:ribonuclease P protein component
LTEKLKGEKKIQHIFKQGQKVFVYPVKVVFLKIPSFNGQKNLLWGVSVSKRYFKKAVDRNRIKRQLREAIRLTVLKTVLSEGEGWQCMFVYCTDEMLHYAALEKSVSKAFDKMRKN